jgi:hypothetical protein
LVEEAIETMIYHANLDHEAGIAMPPRHALVNGGQPAVRRGKIQRESRAGEKR